MAQRKSSTVTDGVFDYLSQNIYSGIWKPGDKLPSEAQLCSQLGASRITVRSALGRLSALGLVQSQQGKGTFVSVQPVMSSMPPLPVQNTDRLSVFEFRKIIEGESAALAAIRATSADVQAMQNAILGMENGKNEKEVADQDLLFHALIAKASGNEIIEWVFHIMQEPYSRIFADNVTHLGNVGAEQHRRILLDIQIRDMDAARQHMIAHLDTTVRSVIKP